MNKFRKLFFSLIIMFVCVIGLTYNVKAEEDEITADDIVLENYSIDVVLGDDFHLYLRGVPEDVPAATNYYVKFVSEGTSKLTIDDFYEDTSVIGWKVGNYSFVNDTSGSSTFQEINMSDDWFLLKGYTQAYVVKCVKSDNSVCKMSEDPISVKKPELYLPLDERYYASIHDNTFYVSAQFPYLAASEDKRTGEHKIVTKIGIVNDQTLIMSLAKEEYGSLEKLLEYAKKSDGTIYENYDYVDASSRYMSVNFDVVNGAYYYMYSYYTDSSNLYRDIPGVSLVMGKNDALFNNVTFDDVQETEWDKFVKYFKESKDLDEIRAVKDFENLNIQHDSSNLYIELIIGDKEYNTKYTHNKGIVTYDTFGDTYYDTYFNKIALDYIVEKYKFDSESFYKNLYGTDFENSYTLGKNGIEYVADYYTPSGSTEKLVAFEELEFNLNGVILNSVGGPTTPEEEPIIYDFISGENQKYKVEETKELKFEIDADYSLFKNVYVNGKLLDSSSYTTKEGSTIVILKQSYLDKLNNGVHTLKVTFNDGGYAETTFTVEKTVTNPSTGIGLKYTILVLLAIISVGTYLFIRKQSKFPKHN